MHSIKELFRIGYGPSSSHTMGPRSAAADFKSRHPAAKEFRVTLMGSLAATGRGHLTDRAIEEAMAPAKVEIVWRPDIVPAFHPNGMTFEADGESETAYSVGGGRVVREGEAGELEEVYPTNHLDDIIGWCRENGRTFWEYVEVHEGPAIWEYLEKVLIAMIASVERGINAEGVLPGALHLQRKAAQYHVKAGGYQGNVSSRMKVFAYALAVAEENAGGGKIVTAPTCGSCGVLPAVICHLMKSHEFAKIRILRALATAGLIGNVAKFSASISGAEAGCQAEVGVACAMAAAAACQLFGGSITQIEYAAEMGLEHHLGLTCDPICGLVQVPCIERNAYAAARALDCNVFASLSDGTHLVSYDKCLAVMMKTGKDLPSLYRETSLGGLAGIRL